MPSFILYPLSFLVVLGIMIVVHEWGHYAAAKLLGVRVEVFSVGFGPRLLGFRRGETDYRISAIPLGGYVKMSGENPMEAATGDPGEFMSHPRWHRFLIAIAGPFMNVALAVGLLTVVYTFHHPVRATDESPALIGWIKDGSAANKAGVKAGDLIVRLDSVANPKWEDVNQTEELSPDQPLQATVQRGSQTLNLTVTPEPLGPDKVGYAGWEPDEPVEVTEIKETMPAFHAGMRKGDIITSVDGMPMRSVLAFIQHLQDMQGKPVELAVLRNGKNMQFKVQPNLEHSEVDNSPVYRVGFGSARTKVSQLP